MNKELTRRKAATNSTYPKGGVSCAKDSLVVNGSLVLQMKFYGKNPALRVAAKRYLPFLGDCANLNGQK